MLKCVPGKSVQSLWNFDEDNIYQNYSTKSQPFDSEMSHPGIYMINILTYALIYEMVILHHNLQKSKKEWKQPKCQ